MENEQKDDELILKVLMENEKIVKEKNEKTTMWECPKCKVLMDLS